MGHLFQEFQERAWEPGEGEPDRCGAVSIGVGGGELLHGRISAGLCVALVVAKTVYRMLLVCIFTYLLILREVWTAFKIVGPCSQHRACD